MLQQINQVWADDISEKAFRKTPFYAREDRQPRAQASARSGEKFVKQVRDYKNKNDWAR